MSDMNKDSRLLRKVADQARGRILEQLSDREINVCKKNLQLPHVADPITCFPGYKYHLLFI